ncbi:MAG TPA: hypothetical protein VIX82_11045, partial [Solirubrobacteraceae bacterium]
MAKLGQFLVAIDTRLEGVPKKVELDMFETPGPVRIVAVDDPGLHRVKLQTALLESTTDGVQHRPGLSLTPAVDDRIVRIALEPHPGIR